MKVAIKIAKSLEIIDLDEVLYLEADGAFTRIKKTNGNEIKVSKSLTFLCSMFKGYEQIQKCHRSYFANISYVNSVLTVGVQKYKILLENNEIIPLSLSYKKEFTQYLLKNS